MSSSAAPLGETDAEAGARHTLRATRPTNGQDSADALADVVAANELADAALGDAHDGLRLDEVAARGRLDLRASG